MKYFKYWSEDKHQINIGNHNEEINLLVGSNVSKDAAKDVSVQRAKDIELRIANRGFIEEYETSIREFVSDVLDSSNIVSICRYGAKVLNTDEYTVLDLDDYAKSILDIFKPLRKLTKKERIIFKFEVFVSKNPVLGRDFRIYETSKGIRVIGKKYLEPANNEYHRLMTKLNVDWIYLILSRKQQCYRARISPKPYRLGIKTIKVRTPLFCETETYQDWSRMYEDASRDYTVAKFIKFIGSDFSSDQAIQFHDRQCNSDQNFKLA